MGIAKSLFRMTAWLMAPPAERTYEIPLTATELAQRRAASRSYLHRILGTVFLLILVSSAAIAGAYLLIVRYPDSGPGMFAIQFTGLLGGPTAIFMALIWLIATVRRLRGVRLRDWTAYPARSASLGFGPIRWTVVGIDITPTTTLVIFPEQPLRCRIRRRVAREGKALVLWPRPGKAFDIRWYAGIGGRPVYSDYLAPSLTLTSYWERRGLEALDRAGTRPAAPE